MIRKEIQNIDELSIADNKSSIEDLILKQELKKEILYLVNSLKHKDREIFIKYYFNDETIDLIASDLDLSPTQIYNRLSRGRKNLKNIFSSRNI